MTCRCIRWLSRAAASFLLAALLCAAAAAGSARAENARELTLMIYMCGSNLETDAGAGTRDIAEMIRSRFDSERVSVLVMAGGAQNWWSTMVSPNETAIYELTRTRPQKVFSEGLKNMGSPETLTALLRFGAERYPAGHYALVLWDHGGGPIEGLCADERFRGDSLSMEELAQALSDSPFASQKLDWIGFDACLMASVEVADTVAPYASYMVASEETVPDTGWDYSFLREIGQDETALDTIRRVIDLYAAKDGDARRTLSCVNLSAIPALKHQMNYYFLRLMLTVGAESYSQLAGARQASRGFGRAEDAAKDYDLVDLTDLVQRMESRVPSRSILSALSSAILYSRSNVEGSYGLSAYFPFYNKQKYERLQEKGERALSVSYGYASFIRRFGELLLGHSLTDWNSLLISGESEEEDAGVYTLSLTEEQATHLGAAELRVFARSDADIRDKALRQVFVDDAVSVDGGALTARYGGKMLYAVNEKGRPLTGSLSYRMLDGQILLTVIPQRGEEQDAMPVYLLCHEGENGAVTMDSWLAYDAVLDEYNARVAFDRSAYPYLRFAYTYYNPEVDEQGRLLPCAEWKEDQHVQGGWTVRSAEDWHLEFRDAPAYGVSLYAMFQVTDTQNNVYCSDLIPVDNRCLRDVRVYASTPSVSEAGVSVSARVSTAEVLPSLKLFVDIENRTQARVQATAGQLVVNALSVQSEYGSGILQPGETGRIVIELQGNQLTNLRYVYTWEAQLTLRDAETGETLAAFPLTAWMNADVSAFAEQRETASPLLTGTVGAPNGARLGAQLMALEPTEDGSVQALLLIANRSGQDVSGTLGGACALDGAQAVCRETRLFVQAGSSAWKRLVLEDAGALQADGPLLDFTLEGELPVSLTTAGAQPVSGH